MDRKTANIESQIQIWALLGPFVLLLSFVLGFYKLSSQHYYLALIPIVAIPLCLRWRAVGMLAAPVVATVLVFFLYGSLPQSERYWLVGMAMTVSLGMIVTALAMEEVRGLVGCLRQESSSRLENLLRLDEKLRSAEGEWRQQEAGYLRQLQSLQVDVDEKTCTLHRYSELVPQLHGELASMEESRDTLLLELEKNRSDRAKLDQQLHDAQAEIRGLSDAYSMSQGEREKACHKKIGDLEAAIANADQEFIDLHGRLEYAESASMEARANVQQLERYLDGLRQEKEEACRMLKQLQEVHASLRSDFDKIQNRNDAQSASMARVDHELGQARAKCQSLEEQRAALEAAVKRLEAAMAEPQESVSTEELEKLQEERDFLQRSVHRWESMYKQLRCQFEEKGKILGETRAQLFQAENQVMRLQRERREETELGVNEVENSLQQYLHGMEEDLCHVEEEQEWSEQAYMDLIGSLLDELRSKSPTQAAMV